MPNFIDVNLKIKEYQISEVDSKNHIIMQYLDVVLGAIALKLNKMFEIKDETTNRRGKRTIAKEKFYKYINKRIREIYPNFNIGISTGRELESYKWNHSYRHWSFVPKDFEIDDTKYK